MWTTSRRLLRNTLTCGVHGIDLHHTCYCYHQRVNDPANGRKRCLPKWDSKRDPIYVPAQWFQRWQQKGMPFDKDPIWTETVRGRMECRIRRQNAQAQIQTLMCRSMRIYALRKQKNGNHYRL